MTEEESKYAIARLVARWVLGGKKGAEKPEVQDWLVENGYGHFIPKCSKCKGAGWVYCRELDSPCDEEPYQYNLTKHTCDWCKGMGENVVGH